MAETVLIVDDDPVQRRLLEAAMEKFGHSTLAAEDGEKAMSILSAAGEKQVRACILDLVMPGMDGLAVLEAMRSRQIRVPVIVQTAQGSIDTAITAMRAGAFDFVVKPAAPERLRTAIGNALKVHEKEGSAGRARRRQRGTLTFDDIVTQSASMERVLSLGRKAAASGIPILIEGESGVGKELVARAIGGSSGRAEKPFVTVNCGAIPENLVESILFGHEKGSFTGATDRHVGKFVEANGGTLFLDEVGDLPLDAQVKLLRAVQEGEVDPVGGKTSVKVDIRLISATHRDLIRKVREGEFREDLYYRLNVFPIFVPPLRDRRDDIPLLVRHFLMRGAVSDTETKVTGISREALKLLMAYDWPGNIRQLENAVFRAVVLAEGPVLTPDEFPQIRAQVDGIDPTDHLPAASVEFTDTQASESGKTQQAATAVAEDGAGAGTADEDIPAGWLKAFDDRGNIRTLEDMENDIIRFAIEFYDGQMSEVARRLGIGRSTLYRKLREYDIEFDSSSRDKLAS
jgi:DNA-binding NtrC family response regulator